MTHERGNARHPHASRFAAPRQRRAVLDRPRLTERLHANVGTGMAVLLAPAGYGKTALVARFATEVDYEVRWLTLDGSCNAPEVLAEYLGCALLAGSRSWMPATAAKTEDLKAYLGAAIARAQQDSTRPIMLVVDNVHELNDAPESAELVAWVIESLGEGAEIVLCGREAPPLTEVDRRVASGECLLLTSADLAFTGDEIAALALNVGATPPPAEILKATDGWPIAVMASLHGAISPSNTQASLRGEAWHRYLAAEVWLSVPAESQPALLALSVAPVIEPGLAVELAGSETWRRLSGWLLRREFLAEGLDNGAIRLNPVVRRFLLAEYRSRSPAEFLATLERSVAYLERHGQIADAVELARSSDQGALLAGLLERHSTDLLLQGSFGLLWRGYQALSPELLEERPVLRAIGTRILAHHNKPHEALEIAAEIIGDASAPAAARLHALLGRARALRLLGQVDELKGLFEQVREMTGCDDSAVLAELAWQEAQVVLGTTSDFARAERLLLACIDYGEQANASTLALLARSSLGQMFVLRGDGPASVVELSRAAQGWRELGGSANLGWVLNNLGMGHLAVGDYETAASVLGEAMREAQACENLRTEAYAVASLGDAELALGHYAEARGHYEEAIRICATDVLDESLAALSISGLAAALLGLGDVQQADFFARRAMLVAESYENPNEVGQCRLQLAMVEDAAENHASAIAFAQESVELFRSIDARGSLRVAHYRLAMCLFRANRRAEAQQTLKDLEALISEPWMAGVLVPLVREQPMFAQWAAARSLSGRWFRDLLERHAFAPATPVSEQPPARLPKVVAASLGGTHVTIGGRTATDEAWASVRAKELFFLFLANPTGLRKEQAVECLYPEIPRAKCNSAFHSNLYRLRRALYPESVVKNDGAYILNPEGEFEWDVAGFEQALDDAARERPGSDERARLYERALSLYRGPFAEEFHSEWADSLRERLAGQSLVALTTLAGYHAGRQEFEAAADCLERALEHDRYNEEAAYQLATYRLRANGPAAALGFLDEYCQVFASDLGEELPERFQRLRKDIAAGATG